jgi:hypothetical protein
MPDAFLVTTIEGKVIKHCLVLAFILKNMYNFIWGTILAIISDFIPSMGSTKIHMLII